MSKKIKLCVIKGDGIGPEIVGYGIEILNSMTKSFEITEVEAGFAAYQKFKTPLPKETIKACKESDAILFGAVTTPPHIEGYFSPIVKLRKLLNVYANVRPFYSLPLKNTIQGVDFTIVRENTEDLYSGREKKIKGGYIAERVITKDASEKIVYFAFKLAKKRRKKLTVVHKANVLRLTDGLFLDCAKKIAAMNSEIEWNEMLVDSCAFQLIRNPQQFDVIVTTNMFGDILSDEAAAVVGGLGVAASANIGEKYALFEPVHGSAPKYVGKNKINPLAMLFSIVLMLDHLKLYDIAEKLKKAILKSVNAGITTYDLGGAYKTTEVIKSISKNLHA